MQQRCSAVSRPSRDKCPYAIKPPPEGRRQRRRAASILACRRLTRPVPYQAVAAIALSGDVARRPIRGRTESDYHEVPACAAPRRFMASSMLVAVAHSRNPGRVYETGRAPLAHSGCRRAR